MADDNFIITVIGAAVTTIISVVILRSIKYFEKKQDKKAEEVKQTAKEAAIEAKIQAEQIAEELSRKNDERTKQHLENNVKIAEDLKQQNQKRDEDIAKNIANSAEKIRTEQMQQAEKISNDVKLTTSRISQELEKKTDEQSRQVLDKINKVDRTLTGMIESLHHKTELTNDRVSKIRSDMLDLQEEVDKIFDQINHDEITQDPYIKIDRDRRRKIRRKEISNDSILHGVEKTRYIKSGNSNGSSTIITSSASPTTVVAENEKDKLPSSSNSE